MRCRTFIASNTALVFFWQCVFFPMDLHAANSKPIAAVVGFRSADNSVEEKARDYLSRKLEESGKVLLARDIVTAGVVEAVWMQDQTEASARLEKAYQDYLSGKKFFEQLNLSEAINTLSAAVAGYRESIGAIRDNRYLLSAHLYLGIALITMGRETEGRKYIREMILLDASRKDRVLPQREFSPKIVALHKSLTNEVLGEPMGDVEVNARPKEAIVLIDGAIIGPSPIVLTDVPAGEHFVVVEKKGYRKLSRRIVVSPGTNKVPIELEDWQPLACYSFEKRKEAESTDFLNRVADQIAAQIVILGDITYVSRDKVNLTAQLYDARSKEFSKIEKVKTRPSRVKMDMEVLARRLNSHITISGLVVAELGESALALNVKEPPVIATKVEKKKRSTTGEWYEKWWFWTLVGGTLAAGAGTYFFVLRPSGDYNVLHVHNPLGQ